MDIYPVQEQNRALLYEAGPSQQPSRSISGAKSQDGSGSKRARANQVRMMNLISSNTQKVDLQSIWKYMPSPVLVSETAVKTSDTIKRIQGLSVYSALGSSSAASAAPAPAPAPGPGNGNGLGKGNGNGNGNGHGNNV
jgi:hypothetical protein